MLKDISSILVSLRISSMATKAQHQPDCFIQIRWTRRSMDTKSLKEVRPAPRVAKSGLHISELYAGRISETKWRMAEIAQVRRFDSHLYK